MKIKSGKLFSAPQIYSGIFNQGFRKLFYSSVLILFFTFNVSAQEIRKNGILPPNSSKITLRIKGLGDEKMISNLRNTLKECK
ncbi:MAG: hypothetical protein ABIT08_08425, partial [Bacteroidia bacterium]